MNDIVYLPIGIALGLSIAAPPGPMNALIANSSLKSPIHGTSVGAGAMSADLIFFVITFLIKNVIPKFVLEILYLIGGIYMLFIAFSVMSSKFIPTSRKGNYLVGLSLGLTNPYQILWWLTVGIFMLTQFSLFIAPGFFLGILIWIITFPRLINYLGYKYSKYIKISSFVVIVLFGLFILYEGLVMIV
ncbi:LysE family transporter [Sulfuracidifex tepidarius]|uniref:Uncharacterized protein n=1 Tax=Sulfuracidifex tepidarius TaxID=1294262 RepID=A0A510E3Q9_9CREN|nr:LysE family transporter [Sulfuracidifex tepidarius]BBG24330.1 hypothetical protein IC006_1640 [Sulfuracidifex tepidarius]BBG27087.1 hypothetical protein IC007_1617 [Sulfuracidifex tepidarius]